MAASTDRSEAGPAERRGNAARSLRLVADALPHCLLAAAPDGTIIFVNQQLNREFGYTREELIGQSVDILMPGGAWNAHAHPGVIEAGPDAPPTGTGPELYGQRRDGSAFPVEIGSRQVTTAEGTFILATVVNIAGRKEAESARKLTVQREIAFDRDIADLSVQFINLPAGDIGRAMREALGRLGEATGVDRCALSYVQPDGTPADPPMWARSIAPAGPAPVQSADRTVWAFETLQSGRSVCFSRREEIADPAMREYYQAVGARSAVVLPLFIATRVVGAIGFSMEREERTWTPEDLDRFRTIAAVFGSVLERARTEAAVAAALAEVDRLRNRLRDENIYLRGEGEERHGSSVIVGNSPALRRTLDQIQQVAHTDSTVLLLGETGTGKELFATRIHELSPRRERPMVRVNCSAIPESLLESELFGREKGAFTGALARQIGRFELADRSSIFFDEIGDLPAEVQVKLLRILEDREVTRLGSVQPIHVDTRIIAATHRDLERQISEGTFREDLFYRLNVFPIQVPPLRERVEDIPFLVWRFVGEFSKAFNKRIDAISRADIAALQSYSWPGNIRELRNIVERAMIVANGTRLSIPLPETSAVPGRRNVRLADVEKEHIRRVLESTDWRIRGPAGAASRLGLRPTTLETRMAKLGLRRPRR